MRNIILKAERSQRIHKLVSPKKMTKKQKNIKKDLFYVFYIKKVEFLFAKGEVFFRKRWSFYSQKVEFLFALFFSNPDRERVLEGSFFLILLKVLRLLITNVPPFSNGGHRIIVSGNRNYFYLKVNDVFRRSVTTMMRGNKKASHRGHTGLLRGQILTALL